MPRDRLWRPAIEFNVAEHCNLRCKHCDQASWMLPTKFADLASFVRDMEVLSTVLQARELKIAGGEPLLNPQLLDFLRAAKDLRIAKRVILLTNGLLLHRAPDELWELIDGMWLTVYPGVKYRFEWDWVQRKADENHVWVWRKETPEFAERLLVEETKNDELVRMVFQNCELAHLESCHTVYEGRYYICSPSVWMQPRLAMRGTTFDNREADSVAIHDNPNLYEDLDRLIRRDEPLEACRYCLGSWARSSPNVQLTRKGGEEFLASRPDDLADLLDPEIIVPRSFTDQNRPA